jgi:hypothetical protein
MSLRAFGTAALRVLKEAPRVPLPTDPAAVRAARSFIYDRVFLVYSAGARGAVCARAEGRGAASYAWSQARRAQMMRMRVLTRRRPPRPAAPRALPYRAVRRPRSAAGGHGALHARAAAQRGARRHVLGCGATQAL